MALLGVTLSCDVDCEECAEARDAAGEGSAATGSAAELTAQAKALEEAYNAVGVAAVPAIAIVVFIASRIALAVHAVINATVPQIILAYATTLLKDVDGKDITGTGQQFTYDPSNSGRIALAVHAVINATVPQIILATSLGVVRTVPGVHPPATRIQDSGRLRHHAANGKRR